jgi:hypothetical protein
VSSMRNELVLHQRTKCNTLFASNYLRLFPLTPLIQTFYFGFQQEVH